MKSSLSGCAPTSMIQACIEREGRKTPRRTTPDSSNACEVFAAKRARGRHSVFLSSSDVTPLKWAIALFASPNTGDLMEAYSRATKKLRRQSEIKRMAVCAGRDLHETLLSFPTHWFGAFCMDCRRVPKLSVAFWEAHPPGCYRPRLRASMHQSKGT